ncbi:Uncharacterised protein [Mycobacteroides abscessus subsp. abscessus]|nr:Uncharacterised protein [Mycobacteroides abscessus subsp. abscessus]
MASGAGRCSGRWRARFGAAHCGDHASAVCLDHGPADSARRRRNRGCAAGGDRFEPWLVERSGGPVQVGHRCLSESRCGSRCHCGINVFGKWTRPGLVHSGDGAASPCGVPTGLWWRWWVGRPAWGRTDVPAAQSGWATDAGLSGRDQSAADGPKRLDLDLQHPGTLSQQQRRSRVQWAARSSAWLGSARTRYSDPGLSERDSVYPRTGQAESRFQRRTNQPRH